LEETDAKAVARLKTGDISGLETLVQRYQLKAVRAAYLITRDKLLAEDLTQAAFLRAYERISQFDSRREFGPWFLRSVINDALKAANKAGRAVSWEQTFQEPGEEPPDLPALDAGPAELFEQSETRQAIGAALDRLPPVQRAAIVLRFYLGFSEAETAEQLGCAPGTIKWRLHSARQQLQNLLGELRPGPKLTEAASSRGHKSREKSNE
jgi:RNA polymerase sigma-70 factor (ECF subfamily)